MTPQLAALLLGCATMTVAPSEVTFQSPTNTRLAQTTETWSKASGRNVTSRQGIGLSLQYQDYPTTLAATASYDGHNCVITLNNGMTLPDPVLDKVLLHEVGHCLGLSHTQDGIMQPYGISDETIQATSAARAGWHCAPPDGGIAG